MKPQSRLLEFYNECENKYGDLKNIPEWYYKDKAKKRLEDAPLKALAQLKTLCGKDEKMMFAYTSSLFVITIIV